MFKMKLPIFPLVVVGILSLCQNSVVVLAQNFNFGGAQTVPISSNRVGLPSEAYSEGECISPQVVMVDFNWIVAQKTFYVPIASQFAHHRYAETLLSRPPSSEAELRQMCLTVEASQAGAALNITNFGYDDREFRQTCSPGAGGSINCLAVGSSAGVNPTKTRATEDFVVAFDGRSYMIIVRCVDGYFRDFKVFSTRPTISHDVYNSVLNVTRILGFDERRIQTMTYDNCLRSSHGLNTSNLPSGRNGPFNNAVLAAPYAQNYNNNPGSNQNFQNIQNYPNNQNNQQLRIDHGQGPIYQGPPYSPYFDPSGGYPPQFL